MSSISELSSNLSPAKRKLLSRLMQEEAARRKVGDAQAAPIPRAGRETPPPLSFTQQRLWFFDQLHPASSLYNIATAVRLTGDLDVGALERTLNEVVRRHEVLRTTFAAVDGHVSQIIASAAPARLPVTDISHLPPHEREGAARRLAEEEARRPFNLATGPLIRAGLVRLHPSEHVALFTMHHIVSDGWSMGVLVREVAALYGAFSRGEESPLEELPVQYADFAVWQRGWLQGEALERQLSYWKRQLAGIPAALELPGDRPRPPVQTHRGSHYTHVLPGELGEALAELGRGHGATLYMTLLAAFQTLLHRYSGQTDIAVGTDMANRTRPQLEPLIGFFVNLLVMRADLAGDPTFVELLGRVRETALAAHAHCDLPFETLVEALRPERRLSLTPLFQVLFVLQNQPNEEVQLGGLSGRPLDIDDGTAKFDISLIMHESPRGLVATWHYSTDLFDATTVERMAGHFRHLLEGVAADPRRRVSALPLLGPEERELMLVRWNDTRRDYPARHCIHDLFEAQVDRAPERVAVVCEREQLSYGELDARANQLARHLRELGVRPGQTVGVCMERSPEMVVSVLAVLKAGAAYVPMDPSYPLQRLAWMLGDCGVWLLLTQGRLADELPAGSVNVFCVDEEWEPQVGRQSRGRLGRLADEAFPAYVIYTSGSTGRPKGILLRHQGLCNLIAASNELFDVREGGRVMQFSSVGFDVSVWETFMALTAGAALCLGGQNSTFSVEELRARLRGHEVSVALLSPSVLRLLPSEGLPALRTLIAVGEKCTAENVARWAPGRNFFNGYGPAEATVTVSAHLTGADEPRPQGPPIGRPFPNTEFYILDRHLQPVPVGVAGELCVGGTQLALGYVNRPALTAERFVPHPFAREAGARLYRTGDTARYLADGNVEYVGRVDQQVKVRGFRVEPGEVEAVLARSGLVREAVVAVREDEPGDKRLIAYVVAAEGDDTAAGGLQRRLREHLRERVPDYMVPSAFVTLDAMPLTPHGKVDRAVLPPPGPLSTDAGTEFVAPRTEAEKTVAATWQRVLRLESVGTNHNFFDLGGHSLLLAEVYTELRQAFERELTMLDLFRYTTVGSLAAYLAERPAEKSSAAQQFQERARMQKAARGQQRKPARGGETR
jgi:amino acid adenylation domain-containing protein